MGRSRGTPGGHLASERTVVGRDGADERVELSQLRELDLQVNGYQAASVQCRLHGVSLAFGRVHHLGGSKRFREARREAAERTGVVERLGSACGAPMPGTGTSWSSRSPLCRLFKMGRSARSSSPGSTPRAPRRCSSAITGLPGAPRLAGRALCLDHPDQPVAYRWSGEANLDSENLLVAGQEELALERSF